MDSKPIAHKRHQDADSDSSVSKKMKMNHHDVITDDSNQSKQVIFNNRTDDNAARRRREKRLAMNRNSARNRRKKTKVLIEQLQDEVDEINKSKITLQFENETMRARIVKAENDLNEANAKIASLLSSNQRSNSDFELNTSTYLNSNLKLSNDSLLGNRTTTSPNYSSVNRSFVQDHHYPSNIKNSTGVLINDVLKSFNQYNPPSINISNDIRAPRDSVQMFMNQNELSSHRAAAYPPLSRLINMSDQEIATTSASSRAVSYESILRSESDKQLFQESQRQVAINDLLAQQVQENILAKQLQENLLAKQMQENLIARQMQENTEDILKRMGW